MDSTTQQEHDSNNAPNITVQAITPNRATKPERYILLIKPQKKKSKWNSTSGAWDVNLLIPTRPVVDTISIEVLERRRMRSNKKIANGELNIKELQEAMQRGAKEFLKTITIAHDLGGPSELGLTLHLSMDSNRYAGTMSGASGSVKDQTSMHFKTSAHPPTPNKHFETAIPIIAVANHSEFPWDTLQKGLELVECFSKVHPVAEIAWAVISGAFKIVIAQHEREKEIVDLFDELTQVYECAVREDTLNRREEFSTLFDAMVKQSTECCIFISSYSSGQYLTRLLGNMSAAQKIQSFKSAFQDLKRQFNDTLLRVNTITTLELHKHLVALRPQLEDLGLDLKLQHLESRQLSPREPCLAGTRQNTLSRITDWIFQGKESILWLSGVAGCGKSSVMASLNDQLINMGCSSRLATFIRFDRFEFNDPGLLVKTLAHQLALFDSRVGGIIADVLKTQPQILKHSQILEQLQALVLRPLQQCTLMRYEGPIVVLIDGLDECMQEPGGSRLFKQLLSLLSDPQTFQTIPFLRIVIASRPEGCIQQEFRYKEHIHHFPLDITSAETKADILHYLAVKLKTIYIWNSDFEKLCSELDVLDRLSVGASGLFIWAATIFKFVEGFPTEQRLKAVLALKPPRDALSALSSLYSTILSTIVDEADEDIRSLIVAVFGLIISSGQLPGQLPDKVVIIPEPPKLTPSVLLGLLKHCGYDVGHNILPLLSKLGSILPGDLELDSHVYLLHKSLDDFLVDKGRSGNWHVDAIQWSQQLAYACAAIVHSTILENHPQYSPTFWYANSLWISANTVTGWKNTSPVSPHSNPLLDLLQRYFLQWIYVSHLISISIDGEAWDIFASSGSAQTIESLRELEKNATNSSIPDLLSQITSFIDQLTEVHPQKLTLTHTLKVFFLSICEAGPSSPLYKLYIPQFVEIANGSIDFQKILVAIEKEINLESITNKGKAVEELQISGIPNNIEQMLKNTCQSTEGRWQKLSKRSVKN